MSCAGARLLEVRAKNRRSNLPKKSSRGNIKRVILGETIGTLVSE